MCSKTPFRPTSEGKACDLCRQDEWRVEAGVERPWQHNRLICAYPA